MLRMNSRLALIATFLVVLALAWASWAMAQEKATTSSATPMTADEFVTKVALGDMFEVLSGELALKRATSENVKAFARTMVQDHTTSSEEMQSLLKQEGMTQAIPSVLDERHQQQIDELSNAPDSEFESMYIDGQVMAHREALAMFSSYAANGDNEVLKAFAAKHLPHLQRHYDEAKQLQASGM